MATISIPNRFTVLPDLAIWNAIPVDSLIVPTVVLLAGGVVSLVIRYRRAVGVVRLQLRWFVAALTFMVIAITFGLSTLLVVRRGHRGAHLGPRDRGLPAGASRYLRRDPALSAYDIDRILSRTIGWAIVTGILGRCSRASIVGLQALLAPLTDENTLAVAASTLVAVRAVPAAAAAGPAGR